MPDDHRNYAITWFTLAAATGVIASLAIRGKRAELARRAVAAAAKAG
jgi:cytochrome oxidase assembly protein ShyY1